MIKLALWVALEAKPGKEKDLEDFLEVGRILSEAEPKTISWYAVKLGPASYAVFDTFETEDGRDAHLSGRIANALMEQAPELLASPPEIRKAHVIAAK